MKKMAPVLVVAALLVAIGAISVAYLFASKSIGASAGGQTLVVRCTEMGTVHDVSIHNGAVLPVHTDAKLCDRLRITNTDNQLRLLAFGLHTHHQPYDGVTEQPLAQSQSVTVTLNQAGTYTFHDHLADTVVGTFTVVR